MKPNLIIFLSILLMTSCCTNAKDNNKNIRGDGNIISKEVPINNYSEIKVSGAAQLIYEQDTQKASYLRFEIDSNLEEYVQIKNMGDMLVVNSTNNVNPTKFRVYTNSKSLSKVQVSGAGDAELKGRITSQSLTLNASGASNLKAMDLDCEKLFSSISGSANAEIGGRAESINVKVSGASNFQAYGLKSQNVTCFTSGAGNANLCASDSLKASASGASNIQYKGSPKLIDKSRSGAGQIHEK